MSGTQIVCLGAGSEYALGPLATEARRRGHAVVEIDMYELNWRQRCLPLVRHPFVLVTSHHPYLDSHAHMLGFGQPADLDTVGDFIARERPIAAYYVPHDLSDHLHPEEVHSLHLFDALLMPNESYWFLRQWVRVEEVGWIKAGERAALAPVPLTFLPSEVAFYTLDPEAFATRFATILARKPRMKLARFPGAEVLETIARNAGCDVIAPEVVSTAVLKATSAVVSNALSSIVSEAAAMGLSTLCVIDGVHPAAEQRAAFGHLAGVTLASSADAGAWLDAQAANVGRRSGHPARSPAFNFDLALAMILGEASASDSALARS